jgi:signal transduction histidine kinase
MGGTGIGLRIVQSILQTHQAEINLCESKAGAKFRISFIKST